MSWKNEKQRHSLSAKGIKTSINMYNLQNMKMPMIDQDIWDDPNINEQMIRLFWDASISNDFSQIDLDTYFKRLLELINKYHKNYNFEDWIDDTRGTDYNRWETSWQHDKLKFNNYKKQILNILNDVQNPPIKLIDKIILFDKIIHMTHIDNQDWKGGMWIINIDKLRGECDELHRQGRWCHNKRRM